MSYYKSENPEEQIAESIQNLRKEIAKQYSRKQNGNPTYIANRKQLRAQIIPTLKVKLNLGNKIFHSSQHRYELAQLARKKAELRQKNEDLISANPRVQLSQTIRDSLAEFGLTEAPIAVFAIEQLLQEPEKMRIPDYANRAEFDTDLNRTNVGIRKLKRTVDPSAKDFQLKSENISEQFDTNYKKCIYSDDIVTKSATQFGKNSQAVAKLKSIHNEIVEKMANAHDQIPTLQSELLEELDRNGINTGLDTGLQTFWKGFKEKAKKLFNKILHRDESKKSLPEVTDTQMLEGDSSEKNPTPREQFCGELQDFVPETKESVQPETESLKKEPIIPSAEDQGRF